MNSNECNIVGVKCTKDELLEATERAMISKNDVLKELELMRREKILLQHTEKYKIWLADDGRWKTKIPDGSKYGKLVARATKENLENYIVDFYKAKEETDKVTMATIYPNFLEYKYLSSEKGTANKLQWVWNTYYKGSTIIKVELSKMTVGDLSDWLLKLIDERDLTKKKYVEVKGLMNQLYDYCISHNMVQINLPRQIACLQKMFSLKQKQSQKKKLFIPAPPKVKLSKKHLHNLKKRKTPLI